METLPVCENIVSLKISKDREASRDYIHRSGAHFSPTLVSLQWEAALVVSRYGHPTPEFLHAWSLRSPTKFAPILL